MKLNLVPPRTGLLWVKLGVRTFLKQPLALTGLFFMYLAVVLVISELPLVGPVLGPMLVPAATLGLMAATAEAAGGRFPLPTVLVSAFRAGRQRARAMLTLGVIYTVGSLLAGFVGLLIVGDSSAATEAAPSTEIDPRLFLILLLRLPLLVLFWHAPALVHWHGVTPVKSLFFSAVAWVRNFGAFAVYSLAWAAVFVVIGFCVSAIGMMLGGQAVANSIMLPTALVLVAMFTSSLYFTFRDSFRADGDETAAPTALPGGDASP